MFRKILAVSLLFLTTHTFAQNLEAIVSDTRLPVPVDAMPAVYDGEDSIYILGGRTDLYEHTDISKFNVAAETVEKVGTMDPVIAGSAVWTGRKNILYFGGGQSAHGYHSKVWSYKPDGETNWTQIGDLPRHVTYTSSVWDQGEYSYVFGGFDLDVGSINTILRFSSVTNVSVVVGELPGRRTGTSAVWDETTGDAYIFGGSDTVGRLNEIVKFNPTENTTVTLNVTLPLGTSHSCAIWTGTEAYIIGGVPNHGKVVNIVRFNPSTNQVLNVPVNNLPEIYLFHSCVFVKRLNRIYVIGGQALIGGQRDEIMYINLNPSSTNPTTTTPITTTTTTPITTITTAITTTTTTPITTTTTTPITTTTTTPITTTTTTPITTTTTIPITTTTTIPITTTTTIPITKTTTTPIVTTTATAITTTTNEPNNEVGRIRFPDQFCWLLALFVCFHLW